MASASEPATEMAEPNPGPASELRPGADSTSESKTISKQSEPGSHSQSTSKTEAEAEVESIAVSEVEERTFELFPKLAPEIRCMIWKEACSVTRNVDLWVHDSKNFFSALNDWKS